MVHGGAQNTVFVWECLHARAQSTGFPKEMVHGRAQNTVLLGNLCMGELKVRVLKPTEEKGSQKRLFSNDYRQVR